MFFLLRSAVCIGLVVAALPDHAPGKSLRTEPLAATVADGAQALCRSLPDRCLALLRDGLRAGIPDGAATALGRQVASPSRDSLSPADRRPAWTGRDGRRPAGAQRQAVATR